MCRVCTIENNEMQKQFSISQLISGALRPSNMTFRLHEILLNKVRLFLLIYRKLKNITVCCLQNRF